MDWDEQKRRALEVLKDPGAEEQQWLDACDEIGSRKTVPSPALPNILNWPIVMVASFCSGFASIIAGLAFGSAIVSCIYILSMMPVAGSCQMLPVFLFVAGLSSVLGFLIGLCRRTPDKHEGVRAGLLVPIFAATVLSNVFAWNLLPSSLGLGASMMPLLSLFIALMAYRCGSNVLDRLLIEQQRGEQRFDKEQLPVSRTPHQAISLAKSSTNSDSQKSETNSDQLRVHPEKLQLASEILLIEREKVKIERDKLELEREKLQIEVERMKRNTKRRRPDKD
jgi:uncharacterized membrane protein YhiD involved in acid resistance